jgi:asparagine synthase (glutamine-hydrolysing)
VLFRSAAVLAYLDQSIALLSDPIGDPLTVPNALLFREAARHAGIVLNGEGGDPCFGGPKNLPMLLSELYGDPGTSREASYLRAHLKCYDDLEEMLLPSVAEAVAARPLEPAIATQLNDRNCSPRGARPTLGNQPTPAQLTPASA